jgi:hypothetical protein
MIPVACKLFANDLKIFGILDILVMYNSYINDFQEDIKIVHMWSVEWQFIGPEDDLQDY